MSESSFDKAESSSKKIYFALGVVNGLFLNTPRFIQILGTICMGRQFNPTQESSFMGRLAGAGALLLLSVLFGFTGFIYVCGAVFAVSCLAELALHMAGFADMDYHSPPGPLQP